MYERRKDRLLPRSQFARRLALHLGVAASGVLASLAIGMAGYAFFEGLGWRDSFLNAAMILGGMGPVKTDLSPAGKLFAGGYALYSGLVFVVAAGVVLAPVLHRLLHHFHLDEREKG